ncbi:DNA repair protein SWI5 homolog [Cynoglossus semilaevis]|uniref:DNA repair protein SWI5 homolog n=1 Tax=Cynoglossus semilaevis TaxID=244447 RepID=A0A3P8WFN6_CYNSE|nr:DNA repair protein SWI5 homolog [Cynoglossus semilaevis]
MTETQPNETHNIDSCLTSTPVSKDSKTVALRRTPFSKSKKVNSSFKSPVQLAGNSNVSPADELTELERRRQQLDKEITQLEAEGYRVDELERHIDLLHEYNDIKDVGQSLLGRIAALRGTTTRDLYSHFGLDLED